MDLHISELLMILLVTLIVFKPERIPELALILGRWVRWVRQMLSKIKEQIEIHE